MFDRTYIDNSGPSHVSVIEKRAPTDESIRIAEEYREKSEKRILDNLLYNGPLQDNLITAKVIVLNGIMDGPEYIDTIKAIAICSVNGVDVKWSKRFDLSELRDQGKLDGIGDISMDMFLRKEVQTALFARAMTETLWQNFKEESNYNNR